MRKQRILSILLVPGQVIVTLPFHPARPLDFGTRFTNERYANPPLPMRLVRCGTWIWLAASTLRSVTDKRPSSTDSVERDVFQRVWTNDTFSDALTDKVIAAYAKKRKPPKLLRRQGARTGKSLLKQFGVLSKRSSAQKNDGAVLWLPVTGSLSDATVDALEQEARRKGDHYVSLTKSLFDRIRMGARRVWLLDLQGRAKDRRLRFRDVIDHKELPTESEGRYFAILARIRRHIPLTRGNKKRLKDLRLVRRVDSLACEPQTLRPGANSKVAKLLALSQPVGKR